MTSAENSGLALASFCGVLAIFVGFYGLLMLSRRLGVRPLQRSLWPAKPPAQPAQRAEVAPAAVAPVVAAAVAPLVAPPAEPEPVKAAPPEAPAPAAPIHAAPGHAAPAQTALGQA